MKQLSINFDASGNKKKTKINIDKKKSFFEKRLNEMILRFTAKNCLHRDNIKLLKNKKKNKKENDDKKTLFFVQYEYPYDKNKEKQAEFREKIFSIEYLKREGIRIDVPYFAYHDTDFDKKKFSAYDNTEEISSAIKIMLSYETMSNSIYDELEKIILYQYLNYESKELHFGCCNDTNKCRREKKCFHENKLYAKGCKQGRRLKLL
ncbi:MAG: hypothetical protein LBD41_00450 [Clostridiales Family XIII bacterium]|jgi:hypothetical protein|nr:hypothetical protein [Clostridiales Family XIII bacterium]